MQTISDTQPNLNIRQAANAYRQAYQHREQTPVERLIQVVDGLIRNLMLAKKAHGERRLDQMWIQNCKSFRILTVLLSHLETKPEDSEETKAAAAWLDGLYRYVHEHLTHVLHAPAPQAEFDTLIATVTIVSKRLRTINAEMKGTHP